MRKTVRIFSVALSVLLVSGMTTSCRKTSKSKNSTVAKDDPWFDSSRFTLKMEKSDTDSLMVN